ncbi:hypothetical protein HANVADRAFT_54289 [Hanseniaspora valbyensis NRRL Y-1626]|uniref:Uncharacterized protein n=1 Tax=Hanseniaspora valbyensis NRRL Y-1626 TaxID=766949 RepID=A0A1B7T7V8_9ASCO|nr:hypothetical protein HANVADRAFT_54289 [Hanseniaspora valbyensis NRRL Y-1626]
MRLYLVLSAGIYYYYKAYGEGQNKIYECRNKKRVKYGKGVTQSEKYLEFLGIKNKNLSY